MSLFIRVRLDKFILQQSPNIYARRIFNFNGHKCIPIKNAIGYTYSSQRYHRTNLIPQREFWKQAVQSYPQGIRTQGDFLHFHVCKSISSIKAGHFGVNFHRSFSRERLRIHGSIPGKRQTEFVRMYIPSILQHIHIICTDALSRNRQASHFARSKIHRNIMRTHRANIFSDNPERAFRFHYDMPRFSRKNHDTISIRRQNQQRIIVQIFRGNIKGMII